MSTCRNSPDGHRAGPPDVHGHHFCIHCGHPLVALPHEDQFGGRGCVVVVVAFLLLILLAYFVR